MNQILESVILKKYLTIAVNYIPRAVNTHNHFQFNCNICGDSKKSKSKMRGHLYLDDRNLSKPLWVYKCFNEGDCKAAGDGNAWSGESWLKFCFPELHRNYVRELMQSKSKPKNKIKETIDETEELIKKHFKKYKRQKIKETKIKNDKESKDIRYFVPILNSNRKIFKSAVSLCESRKIPKEIYSKFYVCHQGHYYKDRMIIPFYDNNNKIYYWQARSLNGAEPKYLNKRSGKDEAVYNLYNINKNEPVVVLEGAIDSMFVDNSIGVCGLSLSDKVKSIIDEYDSYYLFDNDAAGRKKSLEYLKQNKKVFLWKKFKYYNQFSQKQDINEIIIKHNLNKFKFDDLKDCFSASRFDSVFI